ncbi:unnamed protein product [Mortierella alpina]
MGIAGVGRRGRAAAAAFVFPGAIDLSEQNANPCVSKTKGQRFKGRQHQWMETSVLAPTSTTDTNAFMAAGFDRKVLGIRTLIQVSYRSMPQNDWDDRSAANHIGERPLQKDEAHLFFPQ